MVPTCHKCGFSVDGEHSEAGDEIAPGLYGMGRTPKEQETTPLKFPANGIGYEDG